MYTSDPTIMSRSSVAMVEELPSVTSATNGWAEKCCSTLIVVPLIATPTVLRLVT